MFKFWYRIFWIEKFWIIWTNDGSKQGSKYQCRSYRTPPKKLKFNDHIASWPSKFDVSGTDLASIILNLQINDTIGRENLSLLIYNFAINHHRSWTPTFCTKFNPKTGYLKNQFRHREKWLKSQPWNRIYHVTYLPKNYPSNEYQWNNSLQKS